MKNNIIIQTIIYLFGRVFNRGNITNGGDIVGGNKTVITQVHHGNGNNISGDYVDKKTTKNNVSASVEITIQGDIKKLEITNLGIFVDGENVAPLEYYTNKNVTVQISSSAKINSVQTESANIICGDIQNNVTTGSGDVQCGNIQNNVTTGSGDIKCYNVGGGINTASGKINCANVSGNVKTVTGNITINKK